jgi:glycosyltransferase involved in cell wall biosynthesis
MERVVGFSDFLNFRVGGGEDAIRELLAIEHQKGNKITTVSFPEVYFRGRVFPFKEAGFDTRIALINKAIRLPAFPFFDWWLNRGKVSQYFKNTEAERLITFYLYASAAIDGFEGGAKVWYVQSEAELGIVRNHFPIGLSQVFKIIYYGLDYPFRRLYRAYVEKILFGVSGLNVICNSSYTAELLKQYFHYDKVEILYPVFEINSLVESFANGKGDYVGAKGVVFVGDLAHKGIKIARDVAQYLPHVQFYFFSRKAKSQFNQGNITYVPWENSRVEVYKRAYLVIVPSLEGETFGRVAREAYDLGIPVLASNAGGLPEAVYHDSACLVNDFKNPQAWVRAIKSKLTEIKSQS